MYGGEPESPRAVASPLGTAAQVASSGRWCQEWRGTTEEGDYIEQLCECNAATVGDDDSSGYCTVRGPRARRRRARRRRARRRARQPGDATSPTEPSAQPRSPSRTVVSVARGAGVGRGTRSSRRVHCGAVRLGESILEGRQGGSDEIVGLIAGSDVPTPLVGGGRRAAGVQRRGETKHRGETPRPWRALRGDAASETPAKTYFEGLFPRNVSQEWSGGRCERVPRGEGNSHGERTRTRPPLYPRPSANPRIRRILEEISPPHSTLPTSAKVGTNTRCEGKKNDKTSMK